MLHSPLFPAGVACAVSETGSAMPVSTMAQGGQEELLRLRGDLRLVVPARTERSWLANVAGLEPPGPEAPAETQLPPLRAATAVQTVAVGLATKAAKSGHLL